MIVRLNVHVRRSLLLVVLTTLGACSLSKPYPAKQLYALDVPAPARYASTPGGTTLRVQPVRVTEPYGERDFHYRVGAARFESDYYANFVDEPRRLLTAEFTEWLAQTGDYAAVVDASSTVQTNRSVQLVVNELFADLSDTQSPRVVVAVRVFLLDESKVETKVLLTRDYRETEPASGADGDAIVEAWGTALARIFERIATDIRAAL